MYITAVREEKKVSWGEATDSTRNEENQETEK